MEAARIHTMSIEPYAWLQSFAWPHMIRSFVRCQRRVFSSLEPLGSWVSLYYRQALSSSIRRCPSIVRETKFVWGVWVTATPVYGKNPLKIFFSGTKEPITLGLGMQHRGFWPNKVCSNDDLGLTLTHITARSNLLPYVFIWENIHLFRKHVRKSFKEGNL